MKKTNLNDYYCIIPFQNLEITLNSFHICCPTWLSLKLESEEYNIRDIWNNEIVEEIRNSVTDGTFKYCSKTGCPHLSNLIQNGIATGPILNKEKNSYVFDKNAPSIVVMNMDKTCNFKCPSCRKNLIVNNQSENEKVTKRIQEIEDNFSYNLIRISISETGDPFASVVFRNYLRNFNSEKYPKLKSIHLHTNASLWDEKMWSSMPNIHKYVKTCEISIDAGTKDTYENKTRIGGDWDVLIKNLNFINTIPHLRTIKTSFVVQDTNYKEMSIFYDLMYSIFGNKVRVFFGKITNWGTYNKFEYEAKQIWNTNHNEYENFCKEFNKVCKNPFVSHNLHEFIKNKDNLI